jgi:hypothetical protein
MQGPGAAVQHSKQRSRPQTAADRSTQHNSSLSLKLSDVCWDSTFHAGSAGSGYGLASDCDIGML